MFHSRGRTSSVVRRGALTIPFWLLSVLVLGSLGTVPPLSPHGTADAYLIVIDDDLLPAFVELQAWIHTEGGRAAILNARPADSVEYLARVGAKHGFSTIIVAGGDYGQAERPGVYSAPVSSLDEAWDWVERCRQSGLPLGPEVFTPTLLTRLGSPGLLIPAGQIDRP